MTHSSPRDHERIRIAVAEDDDEQREALEAVLKGYGYEVVAFEDGFELVDYFELAGAAPSAKIPWPDLVVSDVQMPGRTGLEALKLARARGMQAPIVIVTGFESGQLHEQVKHLGEALVFSKPIDIDRLAVAVSSLVELKQRKRGELPVAM
jgi:CheY-like chemotaxis protein